MLKGAHKSYIEVRNENFKKIHLTFLTEFLDTKVFFLDYLISDFDI
jgi:hypothetical protein